MAPPARLPALLAGAVLFLAAAIPPLPARAADPPPAPAWERGLLADGLQIDTHSKYAGTVDYQALVNGAAATRARAFQNLSQRLGQDFTDDHSILIRFRDQGETRRGGSSLHAHRITERAGEREIQVVEVFLEYVVNRQVDVVEELTHELLHAVMRTAMGAARYTAVPEWVREGMALWAAEQGPARVRYVLESIVPGEEGRYLDGLEDPQHDFNDYAEDALAFDYLEREAGARAIGEFYRLMTSGGKSYREALSAAAAMTWEAFRDGADAHAREVILSVLEGPGPMMAKARAALQRRDWDGAAGLLDELLAAHPDAYCAGQARYYRAKCDLYRHQLDSALLGYQWVVSVHIRDTGLVDDAQCMIAHVAIRQKRWREALAAADTVLRDFTYSTQMIPRARLYRSEALFALDRIDEAKAELRKLAAEYDKTPEGVEAVRRLGKLGERPGRPEKKSKGKKDKKPADPAPDQPVDEGFEEADPPPAPRK